MTWGYPTSGGDSSSVESKLRDVKRVYSHSDAFVAMLQNNTVVTRGRSEPGDYSELTNFVVDTIYSDSDIENTSFAATSMNGEAIVWGQNLWNSVKCNLEKSLLSECENRL